MSERAARAELAGRQEGSDLAEEATMVRVPDAAAQVRSAPVRALRGFFAGIGQLLITADRFRAEDAERERAEHAGALDGEALDRDTQGGPAQREREGGQRTAAGRERSPAEDDRGGDGRDGRYEPLTVPVGRAAARQHRDGRAGRHRATGLQGPAASAQSPTRRFRSLDSTGNVRLLTADETAEDHGADEALPFAAAPAGTASAKAGAVPAPRHDIAAAAPAARAERASVSAADLPVPGYDQLTLASLRSRLRYLDAGQLRVLADYEKATANRPDVVGMFERRIAKLRASDAHAT